MTNELADLKMKIEGTGKSTKTVNSMLHSSSMILILLHSDAVLITEHSIFVKFWKIHTRIK